MPKLDKNLTGEQIQQVLDSLLYTALAPLVKNTSLFDVQLIYVITLISRNRKRKLCSIDREEAISYLSCALSTNDPVLKMECIRNAKIERLFLHSFITKTLDHLSNYTDLYSNYLRSLNKPTRLRYYSYLHAIETDVGCYKDRSLYPIIATSTEYIKQYYKFRSAILDHYVKSVSKSVSSYIKANANSQYDYGDIRQNMLKSILTAIDKYDSSKGALTSYINWWLLNAQTCSSGEHEYGIAYTVPSAHKKKMVNTKTHLVNFSVSLDAGTRDSESNKSLYNKVDSNAVPVLSMVESMEQEKIMLYLAKLADTKGLARLDLELDEYFSIAEKEKMIKRMEKDFKGNVPYDDRQTLLAS